MSQVTTITLTPLEPTVHEFGVTDDIRLAVDNCRSYNEALVKIRAWFNSLPEKPSQADLQFLKFCERH
jgi:hypothetical protein